MFEKDNIPADRYSDLLSTGYLTDFDLNIKPSTCAYITKVAADTSQGNLVWTYLCGIKRWTLWYQLIASNTPLKGSTQTGNYESRVSGALGLDGYAEDSIIRRDFFVCKYCDRTTGKATKHGISGEEFVEFPMCNCYTPRGGLAISVFDGAVQGHLATGYVPDPNDPDKSKEFQNVYNIWNTYKDPAVGSPPAYAGGIPKYTPDNLADKVAFNPKLSITQMMLNARALVAPCCWYTGTEPYIYKPEDFRVIDLAIAMDVIRRKNPDALPDLKNMPTMTQKAGVSDVASYTYEEGDVFYEGLSIIKTDGTEQVLTKEDAYLLNSLFGRHYDWTLPDCGNNKRVIYVLKQSHVLPTYGILPQDKDSAGCKPMWFNYKEDSPLSPTKCSHPDCSTKYIWGHVCNGGGAFSLSDGRACPYYQNPLMGDKDTEKRYCKLQNMYPGDSVSAAAMLQIMWLSKGGLPWTEEEWKSTWLNPYIWTTVPFNPVFKQTNKFYDDNGNEVEGFWHYEYEVYSRKTKINPATGEVELLPMRKLPGGSVSAFKRKQDQTMEDGLQVPDIPTIIRKIELRPTGQLKIIWPCPSLSDLTLSVTDTQKYQESLRNLKTKVYNKLVWDSSGLVTNVVGQAMRGQYQTGIYCLNTAFLQGQGSSKNWSQYREYLENKLINMEIASKEMQDLLQELWFDINHSQITGSEPILKNFALLKTYLDNRGMFVFPEVPLSPLDNPNHIIVFGFSAAARIDADIVKIKPIVRHAWTYQKNTKLMSSWKSVWNGRPSLFLNEKYLRENISEPVDEGALEKGGSVIQLGNWYYSTTTGEFVSELYSINDSIRGLENDISSLNQRLRSDPAPSATDKTEIQNTIASKQSQLSALRAAKVNAEKNAYSQEINQVQTSEDKAALVSEINKKITTLQEQVKSLTAERDRYTKLGETARAAQIDVTISDKQKEITALEKKRDEASEVAISNPVDVSNDQKVSTTKYSYRDKKKHSNKGDTDTYENGIVKDETTTATTTTILAKETPVENLYVPFLNTDRTEFRDLSKYNTIDMTNSPENISLSIPMDSGVVEWGYLSMGPPSTSRYLAPWKTFAPKALKKVVVYSTRESDKESPNTDATIPKGAKINDKIAKWYKCSSCASTIILVVNPEICHANAEFMIFGLQALLKQKYKDAEGKWQTENKIIKFIPMDYSQVTRPFPGYSTGKTAKRIGVKTVDDVDYTRVEVSEFIEVFEKSSPTRHPWVFFASPVSSSANVKEWRFYNNQLHPTITSADPVTIPDKTEVELYMEYAYIGEMYDENEAKAYEWADSSSKMKTRILFSSPKAGIMRTVFKYNNTQDSIDGYTSVPIGSSTMSTIWPYARQACRDYEITYIWRDTYRGEELTTGNMKNRTATNYAASFSYNKTKGKDRVFTLADQGDHDLGTEFQPKLTYNTTTSTNVQGGTPRNKITRAEWSTNFVDKTAQYITNKNPTYGFPTSEGDICSPQDNVGALYYPYTRTEPTSAFVPRHKTYMWDFLDRWRNKAKDPRDLGCFRMQAYDWCVKGTDVVRIRQWSRHWIYDPKRETTFLGRSKTRGPVFQLEYREYFDLPTKTVFLKPYVATSAYSADQWYCSACNRYFATDVYANDSKCPLCSVTGQVSKHNAWSADWMYLVDRVDSEPVELQSDAETLTEAELAAFVPDDPSLESFNEWKTRVEQLYAYWKSTKDDKTLQSLQREQARGHLRGWIVDYSVGLKFINDTASQATSEEEQKAKEISQKSLVNMLTGCDKYGDKKRLDLGAFQLSDEYVPGSVTPYYGSDPASRGEFEYQEYESRARAAEQEAEKQQAEYKKLQYYQDMIKASPNATVTYSDGTTYGSSQRAAQSDGSTPTGTEDIELAYNNALADETAKKRSYDEAYTDLQKYQDVLASLQKIRTAVEANALITKPFTDGKIYAKVSVIQSIDLKVTQAESSKNAAYAAAAGTVPPFSDPTKNSAYDYAVYVYDQYKAYQDEMVLNPERVKTGFDDGKYYGKIDRLTDPSVAISEQTSKIATQQTLVDQRKAEYEDAKKTTESLKSTKDKLYGQPNATVTDPVTGKTYGNKSTVQSIDTKVEEQSKKATEAQKSATEARSKVEQINAKTARGQARNELSKKTATARAKIEKQCMRYYEYQQTAFGYNYPWSPYDSPPLFGNMGREMFALEICTIGGVISWLPKQSPTVVSTSPTVPSWWTARNPDGEPREMVVMLSPPLECTRVLSTLSSEPNNPFYNYIFDGGPFNEVAPSVKEPTLESRTIFANTYDAQDLRIVTEHDTARYGQPFIRSDVGRFSLTVTSDSKMSQIYVSCNSAAQVDTQDMSEAGLLVQDTSTVTVKGTESYPDPYIDGNSIKAFSVIKGDYMYVGQRYPGYSTSYDHGRFFTGYNTVGSEVPGWAWPSDVRDNLVRGIKTVKWYQDLYPPETTSGTKSATQVQPKYVTDVVNNQGLWAIPSLKCAPYYQRIGFMDDGRDVTGGPTLDEIPNSTGKLQKEKSYADTSFAIVVESERVNENGMVRPPLIWVEKLQNSDFSDIGYFKVPSSDKLMVHRVSTLGELVPVTLEKGDETSKDEYGYPNYKTAFSTGNITDIAGFPGNPAGGANLIVFTTDGIVGQNEAGVYPGLIAGSINYRSIGKVFREKQIPRDWYSNLKLTKQRSILGQNQHKVSATFTLKNFFANALFVKVELNEWFSKSQLSTYLHNISDTIAFEVKVYGTPAPGGETFPTSFPSFTTKLPIDPNTSTKVLEMIYNCDLGITYDLNIDFIWWVRTDPGNFNIGVWKEVPETKKELKPVWTEVPVYATDGSLFTTRWEWVDKWVDVPDTTKYAYLGALIDNITIGALMPGKCAEVITIKETEFGVSTGSECYDDGNSYNFFTECSLKNYKSNWETFDKKTNTETGWWKDSGRLTSEDAAAAGVDQQWMVKAEQQMWEKLRTAEEESSTGGLYDAQGKKKSSALGKEPAAQIFPRVCAELPELPISRLKINAWNALNWGKTPDTRDPYEWPQIKGDKGWTWGGIWTTRMAGPEWVTADQYPTRDMIWWPALPFNEGTFVVKGLYINYGPQYKDESLVINNMHYRGIDPDDKINEYAYKYEVRGFDALLKTIETVEQTTAEDRRSANYSREYGVTYAQKSTGGAGSLSQSVAGDSAGSAFSSTAAGAETWGQTDNTAASKNWADQMAQNAADGILQAANTPNYRVVDQRNWVFLDEINMKVDQVNWNQIAEREEYQKKLWDMSNEYKDALTSVSFTAIVPYHEWNDILEMGGYFLKLEHGFTERGFSCITVADLKEQVDDECNMEWKDWDWSEVTSFSFRDEENKKYPLKAQSTADWRTILARRCGSKWVHKDTEIDGGKVWASWNTEWAKFMKRGRDAIKHAHPVIVSYDCKRKKNVAETEQNLEHFVDSGGVECKDMEQKWKADNLSSWPKTVSNDGGKTLNRADPWWRF